MLSQESKGYSLKLFYAGVSSTNVLAWVGRMFGLGSSTNVLLRGVTVTLLLL